MSCPKAVTSGSSAAQDGHIPTRKLSALQGIGLELRKNSCLDPVKYVNLWIEKGLGIHCLNPKLVVNMQM